MIVYDKNMNEVRLGDTLSDGRDLHKVIKSKSGNLAFKIGRKTMEMEEHCITKLDDQTIVLLDYSICVKGKI